MSVLNIGDAIMQFPPARLILQDQDDGSVSALLCSDDPPEATANGYGGNSYYFDLTLQIADPHQLAGATWTFQSSGADNEDAPDGIFLDGQKTRLLPCELRIVFEEDGVQMLARLEGRFKLVSTDSQAPVMVSVAGALPVCPLTK